MTKIKPASLESTAKNNVCQVSSMYRAGGSDSTVRLWDLEAGLPLSSSRKLGHTIRALSLDDSMLVGFCLYQL